MTKCLTCSRDKEQKHLDSHIVDAYNNNKFHAGVAEVADAADLKSAGVILVGSSPAPGTKSRV